MLCYRINTDVILANLFSESKYPVKYTMKDIRMYFNYLFNSFPIYVSTDLSEYLVLMCAEAYPELYTAYRDNDNEIIIESGGYRPNMEFFMESYNWGFRNYVKWLTQKFISDNTST